MTMQEFLARIEAGVASPEFDMFCAALYYLDDFQERCHHPKEEQYIFRSLNAATSEFREVIDNLHAAHVNSAQAISQLHHSLVHYQGGAVRGLETFRSNVDAYAARMFEHVHCEEDLFARSLEVLSEHDWARIAAAFDENDDPLFGGNRREAFGRLFQRIHVLTPRKLKQGLYSTSRDVLRKA